MGRHGAILFDLLRVRRARAKKGLGLRDMADIFISYSQKDRQRVGFLVDALTAEGYQVWWDREIRAGESFDELIESTLKRVRCVVAVWSQHAVASEWVRAESAWAKDHAKLVSIRIDEEIELPLKFYNVHTLGLVGWEGPRDATGFQALLADIAKIAGPPSLPSNPFPLPGPKPASPLRLPDPRPAPKIPKQPISPLRWSGIAGLIVVFIGALVGGIVLFVLRGGESVPDGTAPTPLRIERPNIERLFEKPKVEIPKTERPKIEKPKPERPKSEKPTPPVSPSPGPDKSPPSTVFRDTPEDGSPGPETVVTPNGGFRTGSPTDKPERDNDKGRTRGDPIGSPTDKPKRDNDKGRTRSDPTPARPSAAPKPIRPHRRDSGRHEDKRRTHGDPRPVRPSSVSRPPPRALPRPPGGPGRR